MASSSKPRRYAEGTAVDAGKSRIEIENLLGKHGASQRQFAVDDETGRTVLTFKMAERFARISLAIDVKSLPRVGEGYYRADTGIKTPQGWQRWGVRQRTEWLAKEREQLNRELMRRLLLVLKAKLELIQDGVTTFEREFLADILLPNGETLHDAVAHRIAAAYQSGEVLPMLPPARGE
jgi:hypothetical protein